MFWDELSEEDRAAVRDSGARRTYEAGATVFREGEEGSYVLVLLSGSLKLTRASLDGTQVLIEIRGPGYLIGETGALDRSPRAATATAIGTVDAVLVPCARFVELIRSRPDIAVATLRSVTRRLRQSVDRRLEAGAGDALARLSGRLVELAAGARPRPDGVIEIESTLTQQELAEWIGMSRDAVVLAMRRLRELHLIETGRRRIRILDLDQLRQAVVE